MNRFFAAIFGCVADAKPQLRESVVPPPPTPLTVVGEVVRCAESRQGGDAARSVIHMAVKCGETVLVFQAEASAHSQLPLVEVGDRVNLDYFVRPDGSLDVRHFGILFPGNVVKPCVGTCVHSGKVIRKAVSRQGGDAARTVIHLAVQTAEGLLVFHASPNIAALPLVIVGDTVSCSFCEGRYVSTELKSFTIAALKCS